MVVAKDNVISREDFDDLLNNIMKFIEDNSISSWILLVPKICEYVDEIKNLDGGGKKKLVMELFSILFQKLQFETSYDSIKNNLSEIIDVIIKVSKGEFVINIRSYLSQLRTLLSKFLPCCA